MTVKLAPGSGVQQHSFEDLAGFTARQWEAWDAMWHHQYLLYGGAAGGGKSYWLRWTLLGLLMYWGSALGIKGARVGLFCETLKALRGRQVSKILIEFPEWLGNLNESTFEYRLRPEYGGGTICLLNLDDPSKYKSEEFAAIAVDELTRNEESIFDLLRSRLRWPGIEQPRFIAATNPGEVGHSWVKRLWISRDFPPHLASRAEQFHFVPAKVSDNPHNPESYALELASLNPDLRAALLDGSWDVFAGQVFQEFRRDLHVCEPFDIPSWWFRWGSNDPGYRDPGCWYWMAVDQDRTVYLYREATFEGQVPYSEQAKRVKAMMGEGERVNAWVTGMDAFNAHPESGKTYCDYYAQGGLANFVKPVHGAGARANMAATWHEYLKPITAEDGKQTSRVRIFKTCTRLIETLPSLPADELHPEQVAECPIDHWYQASGYGLQWWHQRKSHAPTPPKYAKGSLGDVLGHEGVWAPKEAKAPFTFGK